MKTILIIEDEPAYIRLLSDRLKAAYKIFSAQNGKKGLNMALRLHPDLILLDNIMPTMDGLTMLSELRQDTYGKNAKVIILTNLEANSKIIHQTIETKPIYYFLKSDTELEALVQKIDELINKD
ncbi:MAG TPA: response regulator [Patescibacteria group bacterium]|jgi:CheY-like chemotaxis protein|nr:response regulator [Patescibacteria group bacterium]